MYSYRDRVRYYWNTPEIAASVSRLMGNLEKTSIPETLLSDYLPRQYRRVPEGILECAPVFIVLDQVIDTLEPYQRACQQERAAP
jgi:D-tagatose-1,6-bisphosphate aldolase subunit GatZ/KbaZ